MKTIWKFPLAIQDVQTIGLPDTSEILSVAFQGDQLCLWACVLPNRAVKPRTIVMYGTGHEMPTHTDDFHIATVQQAGGLLVWHVFERV